MDITLQNIKEITTTAFQDCIFDKSTYLVALKNFFEQNNTPLGNMIHDEFSFYWNDLFSKQILEHSFFVPFPDFVKPSISLWLLNWKQYIQGAYPHDYFSTALTVREMPLQRFKDETDKLQAFFTYSQEHVSQSLFDSLASGLHLTIPHYYSANTPNDLSNPFKDSFIAAVFYMAKIQSTTSLVKEDDLTNFFQAYYSYFYKDKEKGRDTIFSTSCFSNTDHIKVMEKRLAFLQPRSLEESYLFYHLNVPPSTFAHALNEVVGLKEYAGKDKENYAIMQLQAFFASIKVNVLEDKFQLRHNIKTKKTKI